MKKLLRTTTCVAAALGLILGVGAPTAANASTGESFDLQRATELSRAMMDSGNPADYLANLSSADRNLVIEAATPAKTEISTKVVPVDAVAAESVRQNNGQVPSGNDFVTNGTASPDSIWPGCWQSTVERNEKSLAGNKLWGFSLVAGWCVDTNGVQSSKYDASYIHPNLWFGWTGSGPENQGSAVIGNIARTFVQYKFNYSPPPFIESHPCLRLLGYENRDAYSDWACSVY